MSRIAGTAQIFTSNPMYVLRSSVTGTIDVRSNYTVSCWVKLTTAPSAGNFVYVFAGNDGVNVEQLLIDSTRKLLASNNGTLSAPGATTLVLGTWYYLSMVRSGATVTAYINGVSDATQASASVIANQSTNNYHPLVASTLSVSVCYARGWQTNLTTTEMNTEKASPVAVKTANLIYDLPEDDNANPGLDISGNGNNFTLAGSPASDTGPAMNFRQVYALLTSVEVEYLASLRARGIRPPQSVVFPIRVGIDLDGDRWVEFDDVNGPNLILYPLWFTAIERVIVGGTFTEGMVRSPYGLVEGTLAGSGSGEISATIGSSVQPLALVQGNAQYSVVLWVQGNLGGGDVQVEIRDQNNVVLTTSPIYAFGGSLRKIKYAFTTDISTTALRVRLFRPAGEIGAYTITVTGLGVYEGDSPVDFKSSANTMENVTDYVLQFTTEAGTASDFANLIPIDGRCELVLNNEDKVWSPRNTLSPFYGKLTQGTYVEVQANFTGIWEPIWTGFYNKTDVDTGTKGARQARITCTQGIVHLDEGRVTYTPTLNQLGSDIMRNILFGQELPADRYTWKIGVSAIGVDTVFAAVDAFTDIEAGIVTYPAAGSGLSASSTIRSFLSDLIVNEGGLGFFDRLGRFVFRNRTTLTPTEFS